MKSRFTLHEIAHGGDADASLEDLRRAGCWQIEVLATDPACEVMTVECQLPEGITSPAQLALKFAIL